MRYTDHDTAESVEFSNVARILEDLSIGEWDSPSEVSYPNLVRLENHVQRLQGILHSGQFCLPIYVRFQTDGQQVTLPVLNVELQDQILSIFTPDGKTTLALEEVNHIVTFVDANQKPVFSCDDMDRTEFSAWIGKAQEREVQYQRDERAMNSWLVSSVGMSLIQKPLTYQRQNKEAKDVIAEHQINLQMIVLPNPQVHRFHMNRLIKQPPADENYRDFEKLKLAGHELA